MRGVLISVLGVLALFVPATGEPAQADEAYVCEGGRVAYVRFGELEAKKRTDPCIAAYYGGALSASGHGAADAPSAETAVAIGEDAETGSDAVVLIAGAGEQAPSAPVLKQGPRLASKKVVPPHKVASSGTVGRVIERAVAPPVAHPETDFRNVQILNAAPGEGKVYRHLR